MPRFVLDKNPEIYSDDSLSELMKFFEINPLNSIGPDSIESEVFLKEKQLGARKTIANLIRCKPEEIVFTQSTTDGVNMVSNGLALDSNSNIVIRGMHHEHHANLYPWLHLSKKISLRSLKVDQNGFF